MAELVAISVRMPQDVRRALRILAAKADVSMNVYIVRVLQEAAEGEGGEEEDA